MKKMTIAITLCTTLFLTACGKTSDTESSTPTSSTDSMSGQDAATLSEQTIPADQSVESGMVTSPQSEQAAFEASEAGDAGVTTQGSPND